MKREGKNSRKLGCGTTYVATMATNAKVWYSIYFSDMVMHMAGQAHARSEIGPQKVDPYTVTEQ